MKLVLRKLAMGLILWLGVYPIASAVAHPGGVTWLLVMGSIILGAYACLAVVDTEK